MNIQFLREFIHLAHTLNYRGAARSQFVSPSTLSKHVVAMEEELGTQLFIRDTKEVQLTEMGRVFLSTAISIVNEYDAVLQKINGVHTVQGELKIGGGIRIPVLNEQIYPAILSFERKYPDVTISVTDAQFNDYRNLLLAGEFDIAFSIRLPNQNEEGMVFFDLFKLPLCIWVNDAARFEGREPVTFNDLATMKLRVLEAKDSIYVSYLKDLFARRGIRIHLGKPMNRAFTMEDDEFSMTPLFDPSGLYGDVVQFVGLRDDEAVQFSMVRKHHISNPVALLFFEEAKELIEQSINGATT